MKRFFLILLLAALMGCTAWAAADPLIQVDFPQQVSFEGQFTVYVDAAYVDFGDCKVQKWSDVDAFLAQLPRLKACDMYASPIGKEDAERLHAAFPDVEFGWTLRIGRLKGDIHYVRTDATAFSTAHNHYSFGHDSSDLAVLRFCKNMKALDIGHNRVDDISWLAEMPQLKILIIAINEIRDLSPLAGLTELEYLEMFNNYVKDISALSGMTKLLDLNITYNNIADYSPVYGLKQLERLWVYNSRSRGSYKGIPAEELKRLQQELPNTEINNTNDPTTGTWRLHPRFYIMHDVFHESKVYRPFEE